MTAIHQAQDDQQQTRPAARAGATIPVLAVTERQMTVMRVVQMRVFQPVDLLTPTITSAPVPLIAQPISGDMPLTLEVLLEVTGPASDNPTVCGAHFYARHVGTGQKLLLGLAHASLVSNCYRFTLANVILKPGAYHVQILCDDRRGSGHRLSRTAAAAYHVSITPQVRRRSKNADLLNLTSPSSEALHRRYKHAESVLRREYHCK